MRARNFSFKWLVIVAAVAAGIYYVPGVLRGEKKADAGASMAAMMGGGAPVSVATVVAKPVTEWREFSGMLQAVNAVEVRPRVGGQITAIHFADGAEVKKGQPLFTIDPRPYEAEVSRSKGMLATASAAQVNAAQEMARAQKLIKSKAISQSEYEMKASALKQANGALESARGALRTAEVNLGYTRIVAPISGKISRAEITVGNLVEPAAAPLLASIVDLSPIYASFDIDEKTFLDAIQGVPAAKLKTIPVEVSLGNAQSDALKAAIHSFDNQIAPGSGTIRVRAVLPNADGTLIPGLYARVRLGTADPADSVLINPTAVGTDQDKKFVMVVGEGDKAEYRPVTLGSTVDGLQVVRDGLKPGEKIIVNGLQRVRPGAPIAGTDVDMNTLAPLNPPAGAPLAEPAAAVAP